MNSASVQDYLDVDRPLNHSGVQLDVNRNQNVLVDPGKKGDNDAKVEAGDRTDARADR